MNVTSDAVYSCASHRKKNAGISHERTITVCVYVPGHCPYDSRPLQPIEPIVTVPTDAAQAVLQVPFHYFGDKRLVSTEWTHFDHQSNGARIDNANNQTAKYVPQILWPKMSDDAEAPPVEARALLQIHNVTLADQGIYDLHLRRYDDQCGATARVEVHVLQTPRVHLPMANRMQLVTAGAEIRLPCTVSAGPAPAAIVWSWTTNGTTVHPNDNQTLTQLNATHQMVVLSLWPLEYGLATCTAVPASGGDNVSATVEVLASQGTQERAPPEEPTIVELGGPAKLTCRVSRQTFSRAMRWQRSNGGGIVTPSDDVIVVNNSDSDDGDHNQTAVDFEIVLQFGALRADQVGSYDCVTMRLDGVEVVYRYAVGPRDLWWMYVAIGGGVCVLLAAAGSGLAFYYIGRRIGLNHAAIRDFSTGDMLNYNPHKPSNDQAFTLPYDHSYDFPLNRLIISRTELGSGQYGVVYRAQAIRILAQAKKTTVAVKTLKHGRSDEALHALIAELKIMAHIGKHANVVRLLGAVTSRIRWRKLYLITEFCALGTLRSFLRSRGDHFIDQTGLGTFEIKAKLVAAEQAAATDHAYAITSCDLLVWSLQAARGMQYLGERNVLHGDVAARNCLLNVDRVLKISDFGLSRSLQEEGDYQKMSDVPMPIKWMAIESLRDHIFNTATDVWSYGVLLWEIFSLGQKPYAGVPNEQMAERLQAGHRMLRPPFGTYALHELMRECWHKEARLRPTFGRIADRLQEMVPAGVAHLVPADDEDDGYERQVRMRPRGQLVMLEVPKDQAPLRPLLGPKV